jgi:hypothetical protein
LRDATKIDIGRRESIDSSRLPLQASQTSRLETFLMAAAIDRARAHSERKLAELRRSLELIVPKHEVVLTCGSYARREASGESDLDFFIIGFKPAPADASEPSWVEQCRRTISEIVPVEPSRGWSICQNRN